MVLIFMTICCWSRKIFEGGSRSSQQLWNEGNPLKKHTALKICKGRSWSKREGRGGGGGGGPDPPAPLPLCLAPCVVLLMQFVIAGTTFPAQFHYHDYMDTCVQLFTRSWVQCTPPPVLVSQLYVTSWSSECACVHDFGVMYLHTHCAIAEFLPHPAVQFLDPLRQFRLSLVFQFS